MDSSFNDLDEGSDSLLYYESKENEAPAMTTEATLTSKGQTTIPKGIRDSLHMKECDRMSFTLLPDGTVLMRVKNKSAMEIAGRLHKKGRRAVPIEDLSR
jgi:antitoxin PrlF